MFRRGCLVQCRGNYSWELLVGNCQLMSGSSAEGSALDAGPEVEGTVSVASTDNPTIRRNRAHLDFVNKLIVSGYENNRSSDRPFLSERQSPVERELERAPEPAEEGNQSKSYGYDRESLRNATKQDEKEIAPCLLPPRLHKRLATK